MVSSMTYILIRRQEASCGSDTTCKDEHYPAPTQDLDLVWRIPLHFLQLKGAEKWSAHHILPQVLDSTILYNDPRTQSPRPEPLSEVSCPGGVSSFASSVQAL